MTGQGAGTVLGHNFSMNMDRMDSFIESLDRPLPAYLEELADAARSAEVPIIRPAQMNFMRTLLTLHKPMTILEIGTAVGFSAIYMREFSPAETRITTIENYPPRIEEARKNLAEYDPDGRITLIEGDAVEIVREMAGARDASGDMVRADGAAETAKDAAGAAGSAFDMIFMDGPKGQYVHMYEDVKKLLKPGGILLSDNVLQEGVVLESRYAVTRRDRTIHARMREYLYRLTHDDDYDTTILPIADGTALSVKRK